MHPFPRPRPVVLCILDGWGRRGAGPDNAIETARMPVWHRLMGRWPHAHLQASEHYVGLPDGQMGNSEVGHTNLGAGRLVMQGFAADRRGDRLRRNRPDAASARFGFRVDKSAKVGCET
jgi:bisphosphoglycerate-independent phosphoglycerate mutase (AlkP superfamily)